MSKHTEKGVTIRSLQKPLKLSLSLALNEPTQPRLCYLQKKSSTRPFADRILIVGWTITLKILYTQNDQPYLKIMSPDLGTWGRWFPGCGSSIAVHSERTQETSADHPVHSCERPTAVYREYWHHHPHSAHKHTQNI